MLGEPRRAGPRRRSAAGPSTASARGTASELHAGVHQVPHAGVAFSGLQVLGRQRERGAQHVHAPAVEHAQIERREQPLVRVDDERVGASGAAQDPLVARAPSRRRRRRRRRRAARSFARADRGDRPRTGSTLVSTWCRRSRRPPSAASRPRDRRRSRAPSSVGPHAELGVAGIRAQRVVAEAEQDHRLVDRRVRLLGAIDAHARRGRASGEPCARTVRQRRLARRGERVQRRDRRGVVDDAFERCRAGRSAARSQPSVTSSSSVAAGDVRHSIAC